MKLELNSKTYEIKGFTFGTLCDLEAKKVSVNDLSSKPMTFLREYISIQTGLKPDVVADEINSHVVNGGSIEELMNHVGESLEESGFFQKMVEANKPKTKKVSKSNA